MMDDSLSKYEQEILANVEEFGCHITCVFDPDENDPNFAYSTGFTKSLGQGEVITFGLPKDLMIFMINETMRQCQSGLVLADEVRISGLLEGFDVVARRVLPAHIERDYFNSAMWFHNRTTGKDLATAFQLVWPGAQAGLFPWDEGCSEFVIEQQPPLYSQGTVH